MPSAPAAQGSGFQIDARFRAPVRVSHDDCVCMRLSSALRSIPQVWTISKPPGSFLGDRLRAQAPWFLRILRQYLGYLPARRFYALGRLAASCVFSCAHVRFMTTTLQPPDVRLRRQRDGTAEVCQARSAPIPNPGRLWMAMSPPLMASGSVARSSASNSPVARPWARPSRPSAAAMCVAWARPMAPSRRW